MSPWHLLVPLFFAFLAFLYDWRERIGNGKNFPSATFDASVTAVATFGFFLLVVLLRSVFHGAYTP
jgi:hypothetical protein